MVLSMQRWVGKVAIVTGASVGIGAAIAEALVNEGLIVVGIARRKDNVEALAKKLANKKGKLHAIKADLSSEADIINAFKWVKENLGPIHILINNAAALGQTTWVDGDTDIWRNTLTVNVLGLSIATREAVRDMRKNKVDGHIVHINSTVGHEVLNFPEMNMYPPSKFAVTALSASLRLEFIRMKLNIKITSVSPGPVNTDMLPDFMTKTKEFKKRLAEKQFLDPENISDAVLYALSTEPHVQVQELTVRPVNEGFVYGVN